MPRQSLSPTASRGINGWVIGKLAIGLQYVKKNNLLLSAHLLFSMSRLFSSGCESTRDMPPQPAYESFGKPTREALSCITITTHTPNLHELRGIEAKEIHSNSYG